MSSYRSEKLHRVRGASLRHDCPSFPRWAFSFLPLDEIPQWSESWKGKGVPMKNKFLLLGVLAALFALTLPLYADPGGVSMVSMSTASVDQFAVDAAPVLAIQTVTGIFAQSIAVTAKEGIRLGVGLAVSLVILALLALIVAP